MQIRKKINCDHVHFGKKKYRLFKKAPICFCCCHQRLCIQSHSQIHLSFGNQAGTNATFSTGFLPCVKLLND